MHVLASWVHGLITTLFALTCVLLILVVLLQKGRGGGLSGAFGGVGGHSAFGAKTGDVFTWITVALTALFVLIAIVGNYKFVPPSAGPSTVNVSPDAAGAGAEDGAGSGQSTGGEPAGPPG